jgi:hypothetical protein
MKGLSTGRGTGQKPRLASWRSIIKIEIFATGFRTPDVELSSSSTSTTREAGRNRLRGPVWRSSLRTPMGPENGIPGNQIKAISMLDGEGDQVVRIYVRCTRLHSGKDWSILEDYSRCGIIVSGVSRPRWVQWAALETGTPRWATERLKSTNTLVCQAFSEQGGRPGESYVPRKPFSIGPCHVRAWRGVVGMCVWTLGWAFCTVRGALGTAGILGLCL